MNHHDHIALIRPGITNPGGVWADLGCGSGAFTLALAELLSPQSTIYAVDQDRGALQIMQATFKAHYNGAPAVNLYLRMGDFSMGLDLPVLDGIVMANSLHFIRCKETVLERLYQQIKPGGSLVLVEYNSNRGNPWVPFPIPYLAWEELARTAGFRATRMIGRRPSRFLGEIYAAHSLR